MNLDRAVAGASVTRAVVVARGALGRLPEMLGAIGRGGPCRVVADENTMRAAGAACLGILREAGVATGEPIVLSGVPRLKPRAELARELGESLRAAGATPVAVGSGVLNDLTKYAAQRAGLPYVSVATAASMDGYAASGGAMLDGGFKRTLECAPPLAVIADLDVLAAAPRRMAGWGFGDLAGKIVAGADWILADALGEEAIAPGPFGLVQDGIRAWLADPSGVAAHRPEALAGLVEGLLIAGFAMQAYGNSRPASGAEHQISHVWEMEGLTHAGEPAAHGACVGVGSVAMLALYEWLLARDVAGRAAALVARAPPMADDESEAVNAFARPELAAAARAETRAKRNTPGERARRLGALRENWTALRPRLAGQLIEPAALVLSLEAAGAAARPGDLGVPLRKLARDCRRARLIRRRYTALDALEDLGWLDEAIAAVFTNATLFASPAPASSRAAGA